MKRRTDRGFRLSDLRELNDTAALGACALKEDLGELDLSSGLEQLYKILVGGRPWQLQFTKLCE